MDQRILGVALRLGIAGSPWATAPRAVWLDEPATRKELQLAADEAQEARDKVEHAMDLLLGAAESSQRPENWMKRNLKPIVVGLCLIAALFLTITRGDSDGGVGVTAYEVSGAAPERDATRYDLSDLNVFHRVLMRITDNYVEPERINPRQMAVSALHAVERNVAEVLVQESADHASVTVRVQDVERTFDLKNVDSPWALSSLVQRVFRFIQPHLHASTKLRDVEYAAINGMLSTLDPHSVLLDPDIYNEMRLTTRGEFGGLGIVISMIQGVLTIMNPMKGTPAYKAGLKACDQILKIEEESTVNMTLTQAVQRLRGAPGSKVTITIMHPGSTRRVRKMLRRDVIKMDSVVSHMLAKKIGYVRLTSFQGNSDEDMHQHLRKLRRKGMRGLVLDLRANPGGLLDQAIKIADMFADSGTLVTTVSNAGKQREEKRAHRAGTEDRYPIAVLVNSGSASASEIVAGALKHLDRGVVIGRRTFGKGSVQVLYDNDDGSALKLTIAQYLTSGDISIQSVGITPDISTSPMYVRENFIRLQRHDSLPREKDLRKHLTHRNAHEDKPISTVRYLAEIHRTDEEDEPEPKNLCLFPDRRCKPTETDRFVEDFQIRFARDLLAQAKGWRRSQVLAGANGFFAKTEQSEEHRLVAALQKIGVDWTEASPRQQAGADAKKPAMASSKPPKLSVSVSTDPKGNVAHACKSIKLKVTVQNQDARPVQRLAAVTESTNQILSGLELVFGRIDAGQTRSWTVPIKLRDVPTRVDDVTLKFSDAAHDNYAPYHLQMSVRGVKRPVFAYGYQLIDDVKGNSDGRAQLGEEVRLFVKVRNTGSGAAFRTVTTLQNLSGVGIFIRKGRFVLGRLEPGQSKTASFTFEVQPTYQQPQFKLELSVADIGLQEQVAEKLEFPVAGGGPAPVAASGQVKVESARAAFRAWPSERAPVVGTAPRGLVFKLLGRSGAWYRVMADTNRPAFVALKDAAQTRDSARGRFVGRWQVTPPKIEIHAPSYITEKDQIEIRGVATDESRVKDLYIFVRSPKEDLEGRKVYYQSNSRSKTPKLLDFKANVPLSPGTNYVSVFARENDDVQAQRMVVIYRKSGEQVAQRLGAKPAPH